MMTGEEIRTQALELVGLGPLMRATAGRKEVRIGLIDGPVLVSHPCLQGASLQILPSRFSGGCAQASGEAGLHGTFVAGILCAARGAAAPAICPGCTVLVRPIFSGSPSAPPGELAQAICDTVEAGAHVINLSVALSQPTSRSEDRLREALDHAARRGVLVVAAAGNDGTLGTSAITRHPWVVPVASCDLQGRPAPGSNLGISIGRRGLTAPGEGIASLGPGGQSVTFGGTSAAAPFVTGAIALLWSALPGAGAGDLKRALTLASGHRASVAPPLLNAWQTFLRMGGRKGS